jgi:uncharacterized protein YggE
MRSFTWKQTAALTAVAVVGVAACGGGSSRGAAPSARLTAQTATDNNPAQIRVAGEGKVEGTPDTMTVAMGVTTSDPSAQNALNRNSSEAAQLIAALTDHGVAKKDIQTTDLSVTPNWDRDGHVTGYQASNTVTATLHGLDNAGSVIDAAAATVGNDIRLQSINLSIANTSDLMAKARADAVKDAMTQAHQLAAAGGVQLGPIRTIDDTGSESADYTTNTFAGAKQALAATPIEAGQQQLTFDVVVVYDIAG